MIANAPVALIDFETRSAVNLRACGAWRYALDPTTAVLCMAFRLPFWDEGRTALWHPAFPHLGIAESDDPGLAELFEWIMGGELVEAHNAWFERCIWINKLIPEHGAPPILPEQWRCSAAKAASHALPRGLSDVIAALGLPVQKDLEGAKVMLKLSKPRKSWKKERILWEKTGQIPPALLWHESRELFERLWAYCRVDVLAEEGVSLALPDLNRQESRYYVMDQILNERGFQLDMEAVETALTLIERETLRLNTELATLTEGQVKKASQRAQMTAWFAKHDLYLDDTTADTLDYALEHRTMTPEVRRGVEIVRTLGRSSTAKYQAMKNWADPRDHRVRGGLLFNGASTGRWSGAGVQPHNFVKSEVKDMPGLWTALHTQDPEQIGAFYLANVKRPGGVMEALSQGLRGAIVARPGHQLYVADYSAIEARVVLWLAEDEDALDVFRRGDCIYCEMASDIYGYPCTKAQNPSERAVGKVAVLGLGYQMGAAKFFATCEAWGITITEEFAEQVVRAYREKFWRTKQMWYAQEAAACLAVNNYTRVSAGRVHWFPQGRFLYCQLPSGRRLAYADPEIKMRATPWGDLKPSLTFMGIDPYSRKWKRQTTYGGMLVENQTQAVARDLMASAMYRCEMSGKYAIVLSVHDELIAEAPTGSGSVHEFEQLMAQCPTWASDCPVEAEGWTGTRYRK